MQISQRGHLLVVPICAYSHQKTYPKPASIGVGFSLYVIIPQNYLFFYQVFTKFHILVNLIVYLEIIIVYSEIKTT